MTMISARGARLALVSAAVAAACALSIAPGEAHKAITSKYTYNDDVFPILRDRCARCHVAGGIAPMSLMTYDEAFPWAESIRAELVANHMPPWNAEDGFGAFKQVHTLSPRELDIILTWATGGNPRGQLDQKLPAVALKNDWSMGAPDLPLPLPSEFTVAADKMEDWHEFVVPTATTEPRWIRAVDLLPGTPSIVRSATIFLKERDVSSRASTDGGSPVPDHVLAHWLPGQDPEAAGSAAIRLPAGAQIAVRIHYKKTWQFEGKPLTDRSTLGVYFSKDSNAQELLTFALSSPGAPAKDAKDVTFSRTLTDDVQAVAVSPDEVPANISLEMVAIRPDGSRAPLLRLNTRADWSRRYWFERPLSFPRGTRIEVAAKLDDPDILSAAFGGAPAAAQPAAGPLRLTLNVVRANAKPSAP
jgi:mono/diheme cytochrome c family protein